MTDFVVAIPARYAATRLPGKLTIPVGGKALIAHTIEAALSAGAREVVVATDDERIAKLASQAGVAAIETDATHLSGTDRIAECARRMGWGDEQIIVNLQGDEPLMPAALIARVADVLAEDEAAQMATLATAIGGREQVFDPNCVKVVTDNAKRALYFSRAPIPWHRDAFANTHRSDLPPDIRWLRHIGIYAYRGHYLQTFAKLRPTPLELAESLEQLRALQHGALIHVESVAQHPGTGVDTQDDLERVAKLLAAD